MAKKKKPTARQAEYTGSHLNTEVKQRWARYRTVKGGYKCGAIWVLSAGFVTMSGNFL